MIELTYIYRILASLILGLLIGLEREYNNKDAGLRTTSLVTLGATLFTVISIKMVSIANTLNVLNNYDVGRIIAYTIVGIGFLGTGVIKAGKKGEGLTTSMVLWVMVSTGILCGIGEYLLAIISTILVYIILRLKYIKIIITTKKRIRKVRGKSVKGVSIQKAKKYYGK